MTIGAAELWAEIQLTTSAVAIFTSPLTATGALIKRAVFTNVTGGPVTITVYKVPSGGSAVTANAVTLAYSIAAGTAFVPQELINMVVPPGGAIWALASAGTSINTTASGFTF